MLLTPSPSLSRKFLRSLVENRFISPGGKEYCPEEVTELLNEKESRLASLEFNRELKRRSELSLNQMFQQIRNFQDRILEPSRARESDGPENQSSDYAPSLFAPSQILHLPEKDSSDSIASHQKDKQQIAGSSQARRQRSARGSRGGKMQKPKTMYGLPVIRSSQYTLNQIKKDIAHQAAIEKRLNQAISAKGQ